MATLAKLRNVVMLASVGRPTLEDWLRIMSNEPALAVTVEGIYCGSSGSIREQVLGLTNVAGKPIERYLIMQWHNCRVETAYIS